MALLDTALRTPESPGAFKEVRGFWWAAAAFGFCAFLLLIQLQHYPLWDDEACTALLAKGVWQTGDSYAIQGQNVMAYGDGTMLFGTKDRVHPPLQLYVMAPFIGILGDNAFAARLPMVLVSLCSIALMLWWLMRESTSRAQRIIFIVMLVTNVALFLYMRQARYYSLAILANLGAAYLYLHLPERATWRRVLPLGLVFAAFPLISAQMFAVFATAFVIDYALFGRRRVRFSASGWVALLAPTLLSGIFILLTWNPFVIASSEHYRLSEKVIMAWRSLRDLNLGHMAVGGLVLAAPLVAVMKKRWWLLRAFVAVVVVAVVDAAVDRGMSPWAMIRHMSPIIPLTMLISTGVTLAVWEWKRWAGVVILLLASLTNVLHWGALQPSIRLRSIPYLWAKELIHPPADPYTGTLAWLREHTKPGDTIGVDPYFCRYPLMFHLPDRVYSWQISPQERGHISRAIEDRQYMGVELPQYVINFARREDGVLQDMREVARRQNKRYVEVGSVMIYFRDMYRPEITWRTFETMDITFKYWEAIYIFKLVDGADPTTVPVTQILGPS